LRGYYGGALTVAQAVEPVIGEVGLAPLLEAVKARIAAGMGDREAYDQAADRIDELLSDPAVPEDTAARTLLGLSHAALSIGEPRSAAGYAAEAVSIARKRSEGAVQLEAEAALEAATRSVIVTRNIRPAPTSSAPTLAVDFVRTLAIKPTQALVGT
jgi:hypothetical protein